MAHAKTIKRYEKILASIKKQEELETLGGLLPERKRPYAIEKELAEQKLKQLRGETIQ